MIIIISYDIISSNKRNRIIRVLREYGNRVQKSVFECDVSEKDRLDIFSRLSQIMEGDEEDKDSIRFYKVCEKCLSQTKIIGTGRIEERPDYLII
ncbi:MAG: CRISPR-associated endoribonuclease Cas2 [Parcubacteria group bacterium ADurb.Bin216]|nr:MAG: CRISPR-associated endoribonuclease Cas2 [Parcubacteria group bacterium ADurb.Bin216]